MKSLTLALLISSVSQCATPIRVGFDEERTHLIGDAPVIRTGESHQPFDSVEIAFTIDFNGEVSSAEALDGSPFAERALAMVKGLRFRPFVRHGATVEVRTEEHVWILPPEKVPVQHVPFPQADDFTSVEFSLQRTGCFGSCPSYQVHVHGDGLVEYTGKGYVAVEGRHTGRITINDVQLLLEAFRKADFYSLDEKYIMEVSDSPTFLLEIKIGTAVKTVTDYVGAQVGMPQAISTLEDQFDTIAGTAKWVRGNGDTVSTLRREGFNFKSETAGQILIRVAGSGDEAVVRDLLNAGAPILAPDRGPTVLASAAGSGKPEAVDLLIQHGADAKDPRVLVQAARSGSPAVFSRILQALADAGAVPANIRFLLLNAVSSRDAQAQDLDRALVVRLLLKAGADPNERSSNGSTPLYDVDDADTARVLIEAGADVNAQNRNGETPLMWTTSESVAEVLLNAGADSSIRSKVGKTALDYARARHLLKIAALLEKAANSPPR